MSVHMGKYMPMPPASEFHAYYSYDPESGVMRHKVSRSQVKAGDTAGAPRKGGLVVRLHNQQYFAHRVIWLMQTGVDPVDHTIDHKDRNSRNNRWNNLRLASKRQQIHNQGVRRRSLTGFKGVSHFRGRYRAVITTDGKQTFLGSFKTAEEASAAYRAAARLRHGEFFFGDAQTDLPTTGKEVK